VARFSAPAGVCLLPREEFAPMSSQNQPQKVQVALETTFHSVIGSFLEVIFPRSAAERPAVCKSLSPSRS
jgi:hypothetical protein